MTNIQAYKEMEIRVTLMKNTEWIQMISDLKSFEFEDKKDYSITYKLGSQRKNRTMRFDNVQYDEETNIFVFTRYVRDGWTGEKTNEVRDRMTIKDIELISFTVADTVDYSNFDFSKLI